MRQVLSTIRRSPPCRLWAEPPPGGESPSNVDIVMSGVSVFALNPKGSGYSLTARSALFPRPQPRLNLS